MNPIRGWQEQFLAEDEPFVRFCIWRSAHGLDEAWERSGQDGTDDCKMILRLYALDDEVCAMTAVCNSVEAGVVS